MTLDHSEQEQIDALKAWWNRFGNLVVWILIIALAAYGAWNGWDQYQRKQTIQASQLYEELQTATQAKDLPKAQRISADIQNKYSRTAYAQMAALASAKAALDGKDAKWAKSQFQWVADHGIDEEYQAIAKLRLAGMLLDENAHDAALTLLSTPFPHSMEALVADRRGDIYLAQNKISEARAAYQLALEKMGEKNPGRYLVQLKLDAIGGATPKAVS